MRQGTDPSDPGAEGIKKACSFEWLAYQCRYGYLAGSSFDVTMTHHEGILGWIFIGLLHHNPMLRVRTDPGKVGSGRRQEAGGSRQEAVDSRRRQKAVSSQTLIHKTCVIESDLFGKVCYG